MSEIIPNQEPLVLTVTDRINAIKADQEKFDALQNYLPVFIKDMEKMLSEDFSDKADDELYKVPALHALKNSTLNNDVSLPDPEVKEAVELQIHALLDEFEARY